MFSDEDMIIELDTMIEELMGLKESPPRTSTLGPNWSSHNRLRILKQLAKTLRQKTNGEDLRCY